MSELKVENWKCKICGKDITQATEETEESDDVDVSSHIDISRSAKTAQLEDKEVVADEWNEKMSIQICEACWVDVLNESPSLGKLFYNKSRNCFIY